MSFTEFFLYQTLFQDDLTDVVDNAFPFHKFFADAPQPLFKKTSFEDDMETAEGCFRYLLKVEAEIFNSI